MDDTRTMAQLLEAPIAGYEDAIVVPKISCGQFELKHGLLNLFKKQAILWEWQRRSSCPHPDHVNKHHLYGFEVPTSRVSAHSYQNLSSHHWAMFIEIISMVVQLLVIKLPLFSSSSSDSQSVSRKNFQAYVTGYDAVMWNMQTQVEREPEVTKDTMPPANNGSTKDIPPPVVPVVHHESISEPVNALVSASRPNQKASIPFHIQEIDFLLFEEAESFLALEDDPTSPKVDPTYYDPDGDILLLEAILNSDNSDPSPPSS
ncbi:hypothetical protein Tco_0705110 [Tanacetum coccineum]|uniref:Reverse transcriptase domain-containing protein n=1 Tax=Tanacetum coccineum TaxID=301880 RepID=A0ABQ4Y3Q5_9ASTR